MKAKDKELLLQDLCARLPHGVQVVINNKHNEELVKISQGGYCQTFFSDTWYHIENIKPYLFPMSTLSLTDEEVKEYQDIYASEKCNEVQYKYIDWLNKHHFDYRGLIDKGLAIDATNLNIY